MGYKLKKTIAILGLTDPFVFIGKYWLLIVGLTLAYNFLTGINDWLDIALHIAAGVYTACIGFSTIMMCWLYARSPESRSPYREMAYFFTFLCLVLALIIPCIFIFQ